MLIKAARSVFGLEGMPNGRGNFSPSNVGRILPEGNSRGSGGKLVRVEIHRGLPSNSRDPVDYRRMVAIGRQHQILTHCPTRRSGRDLHRARPHLWHRWSQQWDVTLTAYRHRQGLRTIDDTARVELTAASLLRYLEQRGVVPAGAACTVEPLGGGISNDVWRVESAGDCLVVKQALPFLRVAEVWAYDVGRSSIEHRCLTEINRLLGPDYAPEVVFSDDTQHMFGMTCAPAGGLSWKDQLLAGQIDLRDAYRAGDLLGRIHAASAADGAAAVSFADQQTLIEGRVDPYHRTVAARHEDLALLIDREIERMLATRRALVLGDYAPKNLIAYPDSMLVLDLEVAHWGDPAFDVAFCLNHLSLKALHMPRQRALLAALARAFHAAYCEHAGQLADEAAVVCELGILMVARVDGKSPAEYLDQRSQLLARAIGRSLLLDPPNTVMQAIERVEVAAP